MHDIPVDKPKISAACLRVGETIFTGATHAAALAKIVALPGVPPSEKARLQLAAEDGFLANDGRFLSREEAFVVAVAAGQVSHELKDPDKNKAFYGGDRPRLDSGIVDSYEPLNAVGNGIL
jgi:hypothetical protein